MNVTGPKIIFEWGSFHITETILNAWIVMAVIALLCFWLTRGLRTQNPGKKQIIAEKLVLMVNNLVRTSMGEKYLAYAPYIGTLFAFSMLGSLISLLGMRPVTGDLATTLGWAIVTMVMVQANNIRHHGVGGWLKSFTEPVIVMLPMNIIGELANPVSMAFRHFGNIASGIVISTLIYYALGGLSSMLLSFIPFDFINTIPILQVGLPAILSIYFDLFSGVMQAFIFCMLTMAFVAGAE